MEKLGTQGMLSSITMTATVSADSVDPGKASKNTITIGILSDNILLEIFDRCRKRDDQYNQSPFRVWKWHLLVHVCQRWRQIIFASPRRLDLHLLCTYGIPFRKIMSNWPTIPIIVRLFGVNGPTENDDNVIAALEHPDRVSRINLLVSRIYLSTESEWSKLAVLMQEPFPMLTHLSIDSPFGSPSTVPDGFLGGFAPSLQQLDLCDVLYPALPTLLLSASNLVKLSLRNITPTGYISPETMVSHVAASPKLEILYIEFNTLISFPDPITSPPITRTILPSLHQFSFSGACENLEDFISRIDTPQLNSIVICYSWGREITFDVSQLSKFIYRSECPKESLSRRCKVTVDNDQDMVSFCVGRTTRDEAERWDLEPGISICLGKEIDCQVPLLTNILSHIVPILSDIVHCTIDSVRFMSELEDWDDPFEIYGGLRNYEWLQLLCQLSTLQTLFVSNNISRIISQALERIDREMITEILPILKLLCLDGRPLLYVNKFIALRRNCGHPVTFVETKEVFEQRLKSEP